MKRSRLVYFLAIVAVIALGLLSRQHPKLLPAALGKYPGDSLWAIMVFCGMCFICPCIPTIRAGIFAFVFSCLVEFSQLYHAAWIESVRDTLPGRLVLGRGFSWADIGAYAVGIVIACLGETMFQKINARKN